jgi:hypothetical protein
VALIGQCMPHEAAVFNQTALVISHTLDGQYRRTDARPLHVLARRVYHFQKQRWQLNVASFGGLHESGVLCPSSATRWSKPYVSSRSRDPTVATNSCWRLTSLDKESLPARFASSRLPQWCLSPQQRNTRNHQMPDTPRSV